MTNNTQAKHTQERAASHTPGPWRVQEVDGSLYVRRMGHTIATAYGKTHKSWANARLIASAPEMLDALVQALDSLGQAATVTQNLHHEYVSHGKSGDTNHLLYRSDQIALGIAAVKAAINKATGV